jgi:hypothetical protein
MPLSNGMQAKARMKRPHFETPKHFDLINDVGSSRFNFIVTLKEFMLHNLRDTDAAGY